MEMKNMNRVVKGYGVIFFSMAIASLMLIAYTDLPAILIFGIFYAAALILFVAALIYLNIVGP